MAATDNTKEIPSTVVLIDLVDLAIRRLCQAVVLATGTGLLVSISIGVVSRYAISMGGVDWAEELPKQLFAWFIMAGVVLAVQGGNHIAVDLVMRLLDRRARQGLIVAANLLITSAYVWLCLTALEVAAIAAFEINPILGTPGSLTFYALAAGAALTAVTTFIISVRVLILGADAAPRSQGEE